MTHKRKTADQLYEERVQKLFALTKQINEVLNDCGGMFEELSSTSPSQYSLFNQELWALHCKAGAYENLIDKTELLRAGTDLGEPKFDSIKFDYVYLGALHSTLQQFRNHVTGFKAKVLKAVKG